MASTIPTRRSSTAYGDSARLSSEPSPGTPDPHKQTCPLPNEKVGDHWEPKEGGKKGPSDARAEEGGRNSTAPTAGGVDANATKKHLMDVAKRLDIRGSSRMTKDELIDAIQRANDRETARARS